MNLPFHLFRLEPAPAARAGGASHVVPRIDVQWDRPVFRAPTLPTPNQLGSEVPFFVKFPSKLPRRR